MPTIHLAVKPRFVGPASIGTPLLIKLLREHLGLGLVEATRYVNRCVWEGETVAIPVPTNEIAARLIEALEQYPPPAEVIFSLS